MNDTTKRWAARLAALVGAAGIAGGGLVACCSGQADPVRLGYIEAAQDGYDPVLEHALIGLDARADPETAQRLGLQPLPPSMRESQETNFRRYGEILQELEDYERGLLEADDPITPPGPAEGGE